MHDESAAARMEGRGATQQSELLAAALDYAARGWPVFPLHAPGEHGCSCGNPQCTSIGKHPRTPHGVKDAATDAGQIKAWWGQWPDANIGIATGRESGLIVLDVDSYKGGEDSIPADVPETVTSLTGGGGFHYLFRRPDVPRYKTLSDFLPGLDCRADGGYIVAPPSLHRSGKRYEWEASSEPGSVALATPPEWFLGHIRAGDDPLAVHEVATAGGRVVDIGRHADVNKVMANLARLELPRDIALSIGRQLRDKNRWTRFVHDDELVRGYDGAVKKLASGEWRAPLTPREQSASSEFRFLTSADLARLPTPEWRVDNVLPAQGIGLIIGQSQAGKSFVAIDLAARVACGLPWFDHPTSPCKAVYIALEGRAAIKHRVKAWEVHWNAGKCLPDDFSVVLDPLQLTRPIDVERLSDALAGRELHGGLVIIDTLAQAMAGADENSGADMGLVVEAMQRLQQATEGLVLAVHHMGKDVTRGARGWSGLYAACDAVISVSASGTTRTVSTDSAKGGKAKDAEAVTHECALTGVTVARRDDGAAISSAVLTLEASALATQKLTRGDQRAMDTYRQACLDGLGMIDDAGAFIGLQVDTWREVYYMRSTADTQEAKRKAFTRDRENAVRHGLATVQDDVYRVTGNMMQLSEPEFVKATKSRKQDSGQVRDMSRTCPPPTTGTDTDTPL